MQYAMRILTEVTMTDIFRMFEYKADDQTEFWEVTKSGNTVRVRFGKAGTSGQLHSRRSPE